ncbi:unnamed protein product [Lathyrus oleraceus]
MLHPFSFSKANHVSTKNLSSPLNVNTTSFHFSRKAPTSFSFPYKSFYPHALQSASARTSSPLLDNVKDSKSKNKFFDVELEVREYELDQYGVVHNSVYSCYCQQGWSDFMKSIGINHNEAIESGSAWAMSEISLKFIAPLRPILEANVKGVYLNRYYRPIRILKDMKFKMVKFINENDI